jgi:hypothetical protein
MPAAAKTKPEPLRDLLARLGACPEAIEWAGKRRPRAAWDACERGDWLLWIAEKQGVDRRLLVRAACACARTALQYVPPDEVRPLRAIETAEAWTCGEAGPKEVAAAGAAAGDAAWAAARAAAWAAARDAARDAARAAAGDAAGAAAGDAARAAARDAAWAAAGDAAWAAARAAAGDAAWAAARDAAGAAARAAARDAARAAARAAARDAWAAARDAALKQCADLVRGIIGYDVIRAGKDGP